MNVPMELDAMNHEQIREWLDRALRGSERLPRLTPDEAPHLGVIRLEKTLEAPTRRSLANASQYLLRQFCSTPINDVAYAEELIPLSAALEPAGTVVILAALADRLAEMRDLPLEARMAVLSTLVDTPPPQPAEFWERLLEQDPAKYGGLALSGILAVDPSRAIQALRMMPNNERSGRAAALKLDLTWDALPPRDRFRFTTSVGEALSSCGAEFSGPVRTWVQSKQEASQRSAANPSLRAALKKALGSDGSPRAYTPKLCDHGTECKAA